MFSEFLEHPALKQGPLVYRELALSKGDQVTLVATVEPLAPERAGPYRAAGEASSRPTVRADFSARADLGRLVIEDRTGQEASF